MMLLMKKCLLIVAFLHAKYLCDKESIYNNSTYNTKEKKKKIAKLMLIIININENN